MEEIKRLDVGPNKNEFIVKIEKGVESKPFHGKHNTKELLEFVTSNNIGLVTFVGAHNFRSVGNKGKPLVIGLVDPLHDKTKKFMTELKDLARNGPSRITSKYYFCWMDAVKWEKFILQFNITKSNLPEAMVLDVSSRVFWRDTFDLQKSNLSYFLMAIERGKILPQQHPGSGKNAILETVLRFIESFVDWAVENFHKIMLQLLILIPIFYLSWCMLRKVENMPDAANKSSSVTQTK